MYATLYTNAVRDLGSYNVDMHCTIYNTVIHDEIKKLPLQFKTQAKTINIHHAVYTHLATADPVISRDMFVLLTFEAKSILFFANCLPCSAEMSPTREIEFPRRGAITPGF